MLVRARFRLSSWKSKWVLLGLTGLTIVGCSLNGNVLNHIPKNIFSFLTPTSTGLTSGGSPGDVATNGPVLVSNGLPTGYSLNSSIGQPLGGTSGNTGVPSSLNFATPVMMPAGSKGVVPFSPTSYTVESNVQGFSY